MEEAALLLCGIRIRMGPPRLRSFLPREQQHPQLLIIIHLCRHPAASMWTRAGAADVLIQPRRRRTTAAAAETRRTEEEETSSPWKRAQ